jgi:L-amino acid N-acyltransferase YncA
MTDPLAIRDACAEDLPRIVAIYNEAIPGRRATADTEPISLESRRAWFHQHTPARRPLWIIERRGEVVGWLSLQDFYGRPAYAATAEVSVYVGTDAQGHGVGRRLLTHALEQAPVLGLSALVGFVFAHNAPSVTLFERLRFARWGHLPRVARLDGVERDLLILGRRLE